MDGLKLCETRNAIFGRIALAWVSAQWHEVALRLLLSDLGRKARFHSRSTNRRGVLSLHVFGGVVVRVSVPPGVLVDGYSSVGLSRSLGQHKIVSWSCLIDGVGRTMGL